MKPKITYIMRSSHTEKLRFFIGELHKLITSESVVLDAGCGKKNKLISCHEVRELVGIDIDATAVELNRDISRGIVADLHSFELPQASFDGVVSYDVIEHLERPDMFLERVLTVLKPGGFLFLITPNINSLFGLIAMLTPLRLKRLILTFLNLDKTNEVHYYRANTVLSLQTKLQNMGFSCISLSVLNVLPSSKRFRVVWWPYWQLCRIKYLRRFGPGLLCIAKKK